MACLSSFKPKYTIAVPTLFKARTAIAKRKMIKKTYPFVETFYTEHNALPFFKNLYPILDQRGQKLNPIVGQWYVSSVYKGEPPGSSLRSEFIILLSFFPLG